MSVELVNTAGYPRKAKEWGGRNPPPLFPSENMISVSPELRIKVLLRCSSSAVISYQPIAITSDIVAHQLPTFRVSSSRHLGASRRLTSGDPGATSGGWGDRWLEGPVVETLPDFLDLAEELLVTQLHCFQPSAVSGFVWRRKAYVFFFFFVLNLCLTDIICDIRTHIGFRDFLTIHGSGSGTFKYSLRGRGVSRRAYPRGGGATLPLV